MTYSKWKRERNLKLRDGLNELAVKYRGKKKGKHTIGYIPKTSPPTESKLVELFNNLDHVIEDNSEDMEKLKSLWHDYETTEEPEEEAAEDGDDVPEEPIGESAEGGEAANSEAKQFRMCGYAFLMTYNSLKLGSDLWPAFEQFVRDFVKAKANKVKYWTASFEKSLRSQDPGRVHFQWFVQFEKQIDVKDGKAYMRWALNENEVFNPNIRPNVLAVETDNETKIKFKAPRGATIASSLVTGHFYLAMEGKPGKVCHITNYIPFQDYLPDKVRLDKFLLAGKLNEDWWLRYHSMLTVGFSRAFEDVKAKRKYEAEQKALQMKQESQAIDAELRASGKFIDFPPCLVVDEWKQRFSSLEMRYPILVILGPSHVGKTEFAKSLFRNPLLCVVGGSRFIPDKMREYERYGERRHDAVVFDDCRDLDFIRSHQEIFQGKSTIHELGRSPTGQSSYQVLLHRTPMIFTCNFTSQNLDLLHRCDFCSKKSNVYLLRYPPANFNHLFTPFSYPTDSPVKWANFDRLLSAIHGPMDGSASEPVAKKRKVEELTYENLDRMLALQHQFNEDDEEI